MLFRFVALSLLAICGQSLRAQVELRGGAFVEDAVIEVSAAGVTVELDGAPKRILGWHEVKRVGGTHEADATAYARLSEDLWRAASRLERNDITLAAPIFERLWSDALANEKDPHSVSGVRLIGPTGYAIARGVTAVRIAKGQLADAVEPWAASLALRRSLAGEAGDTASVLEPSLPPVFIQSVAAERLAASDPPDVVAADPFVLALFDLYRGAAARACGVDHTSSQGASGAYADTDAQFLADLIAAQHGAPEASAGAIDRLRETARAEANTWREAWARAAIGVALVNSPASKAPLNGALEFLHIPARFGSTQPYLSGIALAWSSIALEAGGDDEYASALRTELESRYPDHPAIGWLARRIADGGER